MHDNRTITCELLVHGKAMPVILTRAAGDIWLEAGVVDALRLLQPWPPVARQLLPRPAAGHASPGTRLSLKPGRKNVPPPLRRILATLFSLQGRDCGEITVGRTGLGEFERRVLLTIHHLQGQGYAVSIADDLERRSGKPVTLGAVYATVDRLEKKGLVLSRLGEATPERGGKAKRFYQLKAPGLVALSEAREADARMWADAPPLGARA